MTTYIQKHNDKLSQNKNWLQSPTLQLSFLHSVLQLFDQKLSYRAPITPKQFLAETFEKKESDQMLITAKARLTIDLLTIAIDKLVSSSSTTPKPKQVVYE